jgi:hypothetical protein
MCHLHMMYGLREGGRYYGNVPVLSALAETLMFGERALISAVPKTRSYASAAINVSSFANT